VLYSIQVDRKFKPITVQLSLTEACDLKCEYCSVKNRPRSRHISFDLVENLLRDFKELGAKSIELTGGGNPLLYKDSNNSSGKIKDINDVIRVAYWNGYDIGVITNSVKLNNVNKLQHDMIKWLRVSLSGLDQGFQPQDYDFCNFPYENLGFSYIINEKTDEKTLVAIAKLVELHKGNIKFVRFAGDCLIKGNNSLVRKTFSGLLEKNDKYKKFFLKTIDDDDDPYDHGCYVGLIRPYVAPGSQKGNYSVYVCTSHVLEKQAYNSDYALCDVSDVKVAWEKMNEKFKTQGYPYEVRNNGGKNWCNTCSKCYYKFNNKLLHTVSKEMPDKNFP
jgi:organic radical activating enzyme